jgi:molybdopterin-synthase adenylyltransferase
MSDDDNLFARLAPLFDVGALREARVLMAGCGSGGSQVALQLAMAGIRNFSLFDSDILEIENVIRHACGRRYLGQRKVDALADVLLDRNPDIQIERHHSDLMECADLADHVKRSSVVVLATDNEPTRYRLNQICVETKTAFNHLQDPGTAKRRVSHSQSHKTAACGGLGSGLRTLRMIEFFNIRTY